MYLGTEETIIVDLSKGIPLDTKFNLTQMLERAGAVVISKTTPSYLIYDGSGVTASMSRLQSAIEKKFPMLKTEYEEDFNDDEDPTGYTSDEETLTISVK